MLRRRHRRWWVVLVVASELLLEAAAEGEEAAPAGLLSWDVVTASLLLGEVVALSLSRERRRDLR